MAEVKSSYDLKPVSSEGMTLDLILDNLREQIEDERVRQNNTIAANQTADCTKKVKFSSSASRDLSLIDTPHRQFSCQYSWDEITRSESRRILSVWQRRCSVFSEIELGTDYSDRPEEFKFFKKSEWDNIMESGEAPKLPVVSKPRLTMSKASSQHCSILQNGRFFTIFIKLFDGEAALNFEIPEKVWERHRGSKVSRPDITISDDGEITFTFALKENIEAESVKGVTVLGVDLGLTRPYAASLITDNEYTHIGSESLEVSRDFRSRKKIKEQLDRVWKKNKRREALGVVNENSIREEERLRAKLHRTTDSLDWQIASDVVDFTPNGAVIVMENLSWSHGGPVKFRHSLQQQKITHKAKRSGKRVALVNAKNTSKECPDCGDPVEPNSDRMSICSNCNYEADRDEAASLVIGKRKRRKETPKKGVPTPKRPKPRKKIKIEIKKRTGFTGPSLTESTVGDSSGASSVAEYRTPISTVLAQWQKRRENW